MAEAQGANVLHCHRYTPFVYGCCTKLWRRQTQVIFTEHGRLSDARPSSKRQLANRFLRTVPARVYTVSHDLRNHLVGEAFLRGQVRVLHNGITPAAETSARSRADARHALGIPPTAFVVGAVGRLDPVKSLETLVEAVATVQGRAGNTILVLVGDGPERHRLEADVRRLQLETVVRLVGYRSDVSTIMPAFDVYVNASTTEGISLTILEAMSAGLPVVATAVGGTPEVVIDGETGLLVPARDSEALAAAILTVRSLPDRGARLGAMGKRRVLAEFSFDQMVDEYARAYTAAAE